MPTVRRPKLLDRMRQLENWLRLEFPADSPVRVRWMREVRSTDPKDPPEVRRAGYFGETWKEGRTYIITMSKRRCHTRSLAEETLMHEWAHTLAWNTGLRGNQCQGHHSDEWALSYGRIYRAWIDENGWEQARELPMRPVQRGHG